MSSQPSRHLILESKCIGHSLFQLALAGVNCHRFNRRGIVKIFELWHTKKQLESCCHDLFMRFYFRPSYVI